MARNKKVEILSNDKEVLHPVTDGDCVIFSDGQTLTQKLSEDDSVKYTPEVTNSSPMFKVGEGNTVDYSANVLDGAYERATLQGQTYVNNIQESSADTVTLPTPFTDYERTQHNTLTSDTEGTLGINLVGQSYVNTLQHDSEESYVVLGESLELQNKKVEYTKAGQIKSAILKGQTLVNLNSISVNNLPVVSMSNNTQYTLIYQAKNGIEILIDEDNASNWGYFAIPIKTELIKPSTKYFLKGNFKNVTQVRLCTGDGTVVWSNFGYLDGQNYLTFTTFDTLPEVPSNNRMVLFLNLSRKTGNECFAFDMTFIEYQDGMENWDIPFFEGMQSVTVSTKLENRTYYNSSVSSYAKSGKTFVTDGTANGRSIYLHSASQGNLCNIKQGQRYLIQFKISNLVLDGITSVTLQLADSSTNKLFIEENDSSYLPMMYVDKNGIYRKIVRGSDIVDASSFVIKGIASQWENSDSSLRSLTISNIMCIEYQNGMENWDLPYFEDYQVMKPVQVESMNKNLCPVNKNDFYNIHFKAGTEFILSTKDGVASQGGNIVFKDIDGNDMWMGIDSGTTSKKYTLSKDAYSIHNFLQSPDVISYQLEQSSTATSYVPHQSKTTYSWDEVVLRKVGDVEDTLDLTTGEWVQRIGEIVLDGDENCYLTSIEDTPNWYYTNDVQDSCGVIFRLESNSITNGFAFKETDSHLYSLCDKLPVSTRLDSVLKTVTNVVVCGGNTSTASGLSKCYVGLKLQTEKYGNTIAEVKENLKSNPLKILYVMETPIVHKVNLSRPNLQVYDDITHVHTKCLDGTLIPNIYLPSDISYPAMLEPNTTYNVCVNHEVSSSNPLKVNVGGTEATMTDSRITVTTPATLTTDTVSFIGKDNVISETMLIKNTSLLTRDLPHFNGIESVRLGRTIENLCTPNGYWSGSATTTHTFGQDEINFTITKAGSCVWVFPFTRQLENGKKYFCYAPNTYPSTHMAHVSFRHLYNGELTFAYGTTYPIKDYTTVTVNQDKNQFSHVVIGHHGSVPLNSQCTVRYPILCEYVQGMENWDWESIGYFTGTKHIGNEFMKVQNKNLFDGTIQHHYWNAPFTNGNENGIWKQTYDRVACTQRIPVSKGKQYYLSGNNIIRTVITFFKTKSQDELPFDARNGYTFTSPYDGYIEWYISNDNINNPISNIQIEESSTATTYTGHKRNDLYIAPNEPIALTWEQGQVQVITNGDSYTTAINNTLSNRVRNKGLLNLKPNTTYRVSSGNKISFKYHIACFDNNDCAVSAIYGINIAWTRDVDTIFTTTKDVHKFGISVAKNDDSTITPSDINHIRLEEITEVQLRYVSGVRDELDITRGIYTQRVGMMYLDGTNTYSSYLQKIGDSFQPTDTTLITYDIKCPGARLKAAVLCDKLPPRDGGISSTDITFESACIHSTNESCRMTIKKSKAGTLEGFKLWLQDNPLTILYPLKNPIEHKVIIGHKNESNTEITKPNGVFTLPTLYTEQTHIDLQNEGLVPKVESRNYIAYPIIPMVSRTYTLQHNNVGSNDLTIDLCGRTQTLPYSNHKGTVYTPETMDGMLHKEVRISGANNKINHVMLIDGGYMDREVPYFEGMKNACNPVVRNIGENLISQHNANIKNNHHIKIGRLTYDEASFSFIGGQDYCDIQFYVYLVTGKTYRFRADGNFYTQISILEDIQDGYKETKEIQKIENSRSFVYIGKTGWQTVHIAAIQSLSNIQLVEGDVLDSQAERYKENICYVDCGEIRLTEDMFEQGSVGASSVGSHYDSDKAGSQYRIRTQKLIELEIGEQYVFLGDNNYLYSARFYDINGNKVSHSGTYDLSWKGNIPFTILNDAPMCAFFIARVDGKAITPSDVSTINFRLVKVSEIRQLRSLPNGVHDEIDLETGKYIQRVGEVTFSGTDEVWKPGYASWENQRTFYNNRFVDIKLMKGENGSGAAYYDAVRCPQLHRSYMSRLASALIDGVCSYYYSGYQRIFISKQDCETPEQLVEWLKENPITVQYELPEPIVKDIVIHNYPHSYEGGHVIIENGDPNTPIPAQLTYRAVTNRSGQIQQHTEQIEKQEKEINELETLILENIRLSQTRS